MEGKLFHVNVFSALCECLQRSLVVRFVLACLLLVAGSLYLCMFGFIDPESGFGILISVKMLVMAALGGAGQLFGPLVGALILVPLEELSNSYLGGRGAGLTFVVYGAIIVIIARFLPSGLLSLFERRATAPPPKTDAAAPKTVSGHAD